MDTWTLQMGYPVVTVTRDYQNNSMKIKQSRFLSGTPNPDIEVIMTIFSLKFFSSRALVSGGSRGSVEPLNFEKTDFEPLNFLELLGILPHFSQFHRL